MATMTEVNRPKVKQETEVVKALRLALQVMVKGMEVRMQDRWPALKNPLEHAIAEAKKALLIDDKVGDGYIRVKGDACDGDQWEDEDGTWHTLKLPPGGHPIGHITYRIRRCLISAGGWEHGNDR